jgi:hypothetical protein
MEVHVLLFFNLGTMQLFSYRGLLVEKSLHENNGGNGGY